MEGNIVFVLLLVYLLVAGPDVFCVVTPRVGPQSGGTEITLKGYNYNRARNPIVSIGKSPCVTKRVYTNKLVCVTPAVRHRFVNVPLDVTVTWNGYHEIHRHDQFTFRPDPIITHLEPTHSIISGGVMITVMGSGLEVVNKPLLEVSVVYYGTPLHVYSSPCKVQNTSTMLCPTPTLNIVGDDGQLDLSGIILPTPPEAIAPVGRPRYSYLHKPKLSVINHGIPDTELMQYQSRLPRHTKSTNHLWINNGTVEFYSGFLLDGVLSYRDLEELLPRYKRLHVCLDPSIRRWQQDQVVNHGRRMLEVQGDRLTMGLKSSDYMVLIGQTLCTDLDVYDNLLICTAPSSAPPPHRSDQPSRDIIVRVHIGIYKTPFWVGKVIYKMSFFDNPLAKWGIITAAGIAAIVTVVSLAMYIAKRTGKVVS